MSPIALLQESQTRAEFTENSLIQAKTHGGLIFPSESVLKICLRTEQLFRQLFIKKIIIIYYLIK